MSHPVDYSKLTEILCSKCGKTKPVSEFFKYIDSTAPINGWRYRTPCIECNRQSCREYSINNTDQRNARLKKWRINNPLSVKGHDQRGRLKHKYGITLEQVNEMKLSQENKCFLCGREVVRLVIDHDHKTGKVRALLCDKCNSLIGWVETYVSLDKIAAYLDKPCHVDVLIDILGGAK